MAKRRRPLWQELILLVVTAVVLSVVVKTFFAQSFYVPSASMEPTLRGDSQAQDRIVTQKVSYWSGGPDRGDVVVFEDPGGWLDSTRTTPTALQRSLGAVGVRQGGEHLVKRVIGLAGDRVVCCDAKGRLEVNGDAVSEPYLFDQSSTRDQRFDVTVPSDRLWVMGDSATRPTPAPTATVPGTDSSRSRTSSARCGSWCGRGRTGPSSTIPLADRDRLVW